MTAALQIALVLMSYLLGSIPFGLLLAKGAGYGDIRDIGSGNIGATNVLRTGNKKLAILTLLLDGGKGAAAVLITQALFPDEAPLAGLVAFIGHILPVWLRFKGGKGVATAIGVLTALAWPVGLVTIGLWLLIAYITRYSSLAALVSLGLAPAFVMAFGYRDCMWMAVLMLVLIAWKHTKNIERLRTGEEPKINIPSHDKPPATH